MTLRLSMQPFWVRALVSGVPFGLFNGLFICLSSPSDVLSAVITILLSGVGFGLLMAYQGKAIHTELTEAVARLDEIGRSEAIEAVTGGGIPANSAVRHAAIRLGKVYLRRKTDAQLKRQEWWTWLLMLVFVGLAIYLAATCRSKYEAAFGVALAMLFVIAMSSGVVRQRRMQRNIALLNEGAAYP
jgi:uncharacterized membrane protein